MADTRRDSTSFAEDPVSRWLNTMAPQVRNSAPPTMRQPCRIVAEGMCGARHGRGGLPPRGGSVPCCCRRGEKDRNGSTTAATQRRAALTSYARRGAQKEVENNAARCGPFSVLCVEDNDDLRESIGALMEANGRDVLSLPNAEAALAGQRFDLLVTDASLPGMSDTTPPASRPTVTCWRRS